MIVANPHTVLDGADVYELHANTDTHFDVFLRGELVAELGYLHGYILPELGLTKLPPSVLETLAELWGRHLHRRGTI